LVEDVADIWFLIRAFAVCVWKASHKGPQLTALSPPGYSPTTTTDLPKARQRAILASLGGLIFP